MKVEYGQRNGRKSVCEKGGKDVKTWRGKGDGARDGERGIKIWNKSLVIEFQQAFTNFNVSC